jgi:hypothetical protein
MRQRLKSVLALLDDNSIEKLIYRFLAIKHHRLRFSTLMVAMFNANERRLDCYLHPNENSYETVNLNINIDDISHPAGASAAQRFAVGLGLIAAGRAH